MSAEWAALLQAVWAAIVAALVQPWAAAVFGAFMAGWAMGASKNKTAISEIARGVAVGVSAGAFIWFVQRIIDGGAA